MTILDDALALFGLRIEHRRTSHHPGVRYADSHEVIASIFAADAARQKSNSVFFSGGGRRRAVIPSNASALGADPSSRK